MLVSISKQTAPRSIRGRVIADMKEFFFSTLRQLTEVSVLAILELIINLKIIQDPCLTCFLMSVIPHNMYLAEFKHNHCNSRFAQGYNRVEYHPVAHGVRLLQLGTG
jgi:hypothetical protein